jgi:capsular exopolysaccharide synthesis family protein
MNHANNNLQLGNNRNDEIDLKEVISTIANYKYSIILITLFFLIGSSVFAYYKANIYSSNSLLQIMEEKSSIDSSDFMLQALSGESANIDNEIAVIRSRFITLKALRILDLSTNYFSYNALNKKRELYKDSPFLVNVTMLEDVSYIKKFIISPISDGEYQLVLEPVSQYSIKSILDMFGIVKLHEEDKIAYKQIHKFGEEVSTSWFTFTINRIAKLDAKNYYFTFASADSLYNKYIKNLSVSQVSKKASILKMTYQDTVSLRAKEILDAIAFTYMNEGVKQKSKVAELTLGFIDSQLESINTRLQKSEVKLEKYKLKNDVIDLVGKAEMAASKVAGYEATLSEMQTEINILENLQNYMNKNKDLSGLTVGTINFADSTLGSLVVALQTMSNKKSDLLVDFTSIHPEVQKLSKNISTMKKSIKTAVSSSLNQLKQRKKDISRIINKFNKSIESLPSQEKQLARLARPFAVNQKIYEFLLQKKAETAILRSSTIASARILDAAREEGGPIKPKRKLIVLVGIILGLIVSLALAFLREFLTNTMKTSEEIEKLTTLPVYGKLPIRKNTDTSHNLFDEAFRNIRTNLQFLPGNELNKVIAITSAISGEGKTTIAAKLASIMAKGNNKVIVIDLDLRKSSLHEEFDLNNDLGITDILTSQHSLTEVVQHTSDSNLHVITTGKMPPNPSELILSLEFRELLDTLRERYDYIIIDTPPVELVTDAIILINYSDISFAVVRTNYTRKEFLLNINKLANEHATNRMGLIINGIEASKGYGYGYGATYAYGSGRK